MSHPFTAQRFDLDSGAQLLRVTVDPSQGAGVAAPTGSIALRDNSGTGEAWQKTGTGDTDWMQLGAGVGAASLIYQPGGSAGDNVYTSWSELYAAKQALSGPVTIVIDDRYTSPAVVPSGTYDMSGVELCGYAMVADTPPRPHLSLADGCRFNDMHSIRGPLQITGNTTSTPHFGFTESMPFLIREFVYIGCTNAPLIAAANMGYLLLQDACIFTNGTEIDLGSSGSTYLYMFDYCALQGDNLKGGALSAVQLHLNGTSSISDEHANMSGSINLDAGYPRYTIDDVKTAASFDLELGEFTRASKSGGATTGTLPPAAGDAFLTTGVRCGIKEVSGTSGLSVQPDGTDTINGAGSAIAIPAGGGMFFLSDGVSNWEVISQYDPNTVVASAAITDKAIAIGDGGSRSIKAGTWFIDGNDLVVGARGHAIDLSGDGGELIKSDGDATLSMYVNATSRVVLFGIANTYLYATSFICKGIRPSSDGAYQCGQGGLGWLTVVQSRNDLGAVLGDASMGVLMQNREAASVGTPEQYSPHLSLKGFARETGGGSSDEVEMGVQTQPVSGTSASGNFVVWENINDAGYNVLWKFNSGGDLVAGARGYALDLSGDGGEKILSDTDGTIQVFVDGGEICEFSGSGLYAIGILQANTELRIIDDAPLSLGSSQDAQIVYEQANQVPDALMIGVCAVSRNLIITEKADLTVAYGHAQQTNPTLWIHSADGTDTTQWLSFAHDQTDGVIATGKGELVLKPAGNVISVGARGDKLDLSADGGEVIYSDVDSRLRMVAGSYSVIVGWSSGVAVNGKLTSLGNDDLGDSSYPFKNASFRRSAIGESVVEQVEIYNITDAAAGAQQYSGALIFRGKGWQTSTPDTEIVKMALNLEAVQGVTHPSCILAFHASIDGGTYSKIFGFESDGTLDFTSGTLTGTTATHDDCLEIEVGGVRKKVMLGT